MLSIHVILHDARTHQTSEIARMTIANDGTGRRPRGNYVCQTLKRDGLSDHFGSDALDVGFVRNYARKTLPVWYLVTCALHACGYRLPQDVHFGAQSEKYGK